MVALFNASSSDVALHLWKGKYVILLILMVYIQNKCNYKDIGKMPVNT